MAFTPLTFTKSWENAEDFPTYEPDETQVRADLQYLYDEIRDAFNGLVAALNGGLWLLRTRRTVVIQPTPLQDMAA